MERDNLLQNFLTPSFVLLLVGIAGMFAPRAPLQSPRPTDSRAWPVAEQRVEARLWQDPFASICVPDNIDKFTKAGVFVAPREPGERALLLSVVVEGGSYAEDIESRLRTRYAVVTALQRAGYVAADAERIGLALLARRTSRTTAKDVIVAHESFNGGPATPYRTVVVLWLVDRDFSEADDVRALPDELGWTKNLKLEHKVIGPRSSDGLEKFCRQGAAAPGGRAQPEWFSPWATASARRLLQDIGPTRGTRALGLQRCIATDDRLAQATVEELRARLGERRAGGLGVVLLAESDTYYGRALPEEFEGALARSFGRAGGRLKILQATYLRGVDGETGDGASAAAKPAGGAARPAGSGEGEVAHGPRQLDYVRRLAREVAAWMAQQGVSDVAVGVLGSDVYDKLVLLDALRAELPDATYFTTDLDARLAEPDNVRRTQGLLVFSSYGLKPLELSGRTNEKKQAPFRDNYQSATHAATLAALGSVTIDEIARAGAVGKYVIGCGTIQPLEPLQAGALRRWMVGWLGLTLLLLVIAGWRRLKNPLSHRVFRLGGAILGILMMVAGIGAVTFWWRVGAWIGLGLLLVLIVCWDWLGRSRLTELAGHALAQLRAIFAFGVLWSGFCAIGMAGWGWDWHAKESFSLTSGASAWPGEVLRALAVVVLVFSAKYFEFRLVGLHDRLAAKYHLPAPDTCGMRTWVRALGCAGQDIVGFFVRGGEERARTLAAPLAAVWRHYIENGREQSRIVRMAGYAAMFLAGMVFVFALFGLPHFPGRGAVWAAAHWALMIIAIFGMACTVGFVIDASRLSVDFLQGLRDPVMAVGSGPGSSPATMVTIMRLAGEQTHTVGRLVYVPAVAWLFLVTARFSYFDRADWPWSFSLPLLMVGWMLVMRSVVLRNEAECLRRSYLEALSFGAMANAATPEERSKAAEQIASFAAGAFAPLSRQPIVGAVLIPFGGAGALELLQRFAF